MAELPINGETNLVIDTIHADGAEISLPMAILLLATVLTYLFGGSPEREGTAVRCPHDRDERRKGTRGAPEIKYSSTVVNARSQPGSITIRREDPKTIFVRMKGYITGALVAAHRDEFLRLLAQSPTPMWIFDLMEISGFEASAVPNGREWWRAFKSGGGTHVFFVTQYGAARMAASAIGFSIGVKLIVCTSMSEARAEHARASSSATQQA